MDSSNVTEQIGGADFTRRHFIKGAGAMAVFAGALSVGSLDALAAPLAPKRGGKFRVGVVGGANDILDAQYIVAKADQARLVAGFETLMTFNEKFEPVYENGLAESVTAKNSQKYIIKLKKGVKFHNGKPLTADDVIYSFQRLLDPAQRTTGKPLRTFLDASGLVKINPLTVEVNLKLPNVEFTSALANYTYTIVPVGYTGKGDQFGTGPYRLVSFTPGRESVHKRHENYWEAGKPYFDEVRIISFADKTALVNALLAKQIDAAIDLPTEQIRPLKKNKKLGVIENSAGGWLAMCMRIDTAPFNDVNVRQAMRLIVDRKQMMNQVLSGHGKIGNDLFGYIDANYNANGFKQRVQDIPAAVALLAKSGYSKSNPLNVDLFAPDDTAGLIGIVQAFAEQAKKTDGVVVVNAKVVDGGTFWSAKGQYMNAPFYTTYWSPRAYLAQASASMDTYPETKFPPAGSQYRSLYEQAVATLNPTKRRAIVSKMQKEEFETGGYIIPFFNNFADAFTIRLQGVVGRPGQLNLDYYGHGFKNFWFA